MERELKQLFAETKAAIKENDQVKERLESLYSLLSGLLMVCLAVDVASVGDGDVVQGVEKSDHEQQEQQEGRDI